MDTAYSYAMENLCGFSWESPDLQRSSGLLWFPFKGKFHKVTTPSESRCIYCNLNLEGSFPHFKTQLTLNHDLIAYSALGRSHFKHLERDSDCLEINLTYVILNYRTLGDPQHSSWQLHFPEAIYQNDWRWSGLLAEVFFSDKNWKNKESQRSGTWLTGIFLLIAQSLLNLSTSTQN